MKVLIVGGGPSGLSAALAINYIKPNWEICILESYGEPKTSIGAGLGLSCNGLNALAEFCPEASDEIAKRGSVNNYFGFLSQDGEHLGLMPAGSAKRYGRSTVVLNRHTVHQVLIEQVQKIENIEVKFNCKVKSLEENESSARVVLDDDTILYGNFLIGADGVHSSTRKYVQQNRNQPVTEPTYTKLYSTGGDIPANSINLQGSWLSKTGDPKTLMVQGAEGFFGICFLEPEYKQIGFWATFEHPERTWDEWKQFTQDHIRELVTQRAMPYKNADILPQIIEQVNQLKPTLPNVPVYHLPTLKYWHTKRVVLIGDSAHVMPPHSGQGISQCFIDSLQLAYNLKQGLKSDEIDGENLYAIFESFQNTRKPAVEAIIKFSEKTGDTKRDQNWFISWILKMFFKLFLRFAPESLFDKLFKSSFPRLQD